MKFDPKKHGLRSTRRFIRGTVVAEAEGKDLSAADLKVLGQEGGQELVRGGEVVLVDLATNQPLRTARELSAAEAFVDRKADEITDEEIGALSAEEKAAAHAAEAAGRARTTVLSRLA